MNTFTTSSPSLTKSAIALLLLFINVLHSLVHTAQARPTTTTATQYLERRSEHLKGKGTYYDVVGVSSCGFDADEEDDDQLVVALSKELMSEGSYCGRYITVTSKHGSVDLKVIDTCPGCARGDIDMSKAAFDKIGDYDKGHVDVAWSL